MAELTSEEKIWLVEYCLEPENTRMALAVGQIQPDLEGRIRRSFGEGLRKELEKEPSLVPHWNPSEKIGEHKDLILSMTMEEPPGVQLQLRYNKELERFTMGVPLGGEACPEIGCVKDHMPKNVSIELYKTNIHWHWWLYPEDQDLRTDLAALLEEKVKREKIEGFTRVLKVTACAISRALKKE